MRLQIGLNEPELSKFTVRLLTTDAFENSFKSTLMSTKAFEKSSFPKVYGILITSVESKGTGCIVSSEKKYIGFLILMARRSRSRLGDKFSGELNFN